jgi:hypothetical protein
MANARMLFPVKNSAEMGAAVLLFAAISVSAAGIGVRLAKSSGKPELTIDKGRQNPFWPPIHNAETARLAARLAMWAALCCSGIAAVAAFLAHNGMIVTSAASSTSAVLLAAGFGMLAVGIHRLHAWAAVLALGFFLSEWMVNLTVQPLVLTLILLLCFLNGVRGTIAYRRYRSRP